MKIITDVKLSTICVLSLKCKLFEQFYQFCSRQTFPLTLSLPNVAKGKFRPNLQILVSENFDKQIASCESTGRELSFEWSHDHRISSIDSKVRVTLQNSTKQTERVKKTSLTKTYTSYQKRHSVHVVACDLCMFTLIHVLGYFFPLSSQDNPSARAEWVAKI